MSISKCEGIKTKDGKQWRFRVQINGKRYSSKLYATKKEAAEAEAAFRKENSQKDLEAINITFNDAIKEYLEHEKAITKESTYRQEVKLCQHIADSLGPVKIEKLTVRQFQQFRDDITKKGFSASYKNKIVNHCKSITRLMFNRYGVVTRVPDTFRPFKDSAPQKEMNFYTLEEFKKFISVVDDVRYNALFNLLFFNGLRIGEADALTWEDINLKEKKVNINKSINTKLRDIKGGYLITSPKCKSSNRILPLGAPVVKSLNDLYKYYSNIEGFSPCWSVFGGPKALPESTIYKAKEAYCKAAGVKSIRVHDFRHSCVSFLISRGCNITLISRYLGHADIQKTLNTYSHFYASDMDALVNTIDNI